MAKNHSRYLIDEQPIYFHPSLAKEFGIEAAAFLQRLHFRIQISSEHEKEGRWWVYDSYEKWLEDAPYLGSVMTLRRIVDKLRVLKIIVTHQWGKPWGSMRLWYTINYEAIDEFFAPIERERLDSRLRRDPSTHEETQRIDALESGQQVASVALPPSVQNEQVICSKRTDLIDLKNNNEENKKEILEARDAREQKPELPAQLEEKPKRRRKVETRDASLDELVLPPWLDVEIWQNWIGFRREDMKIPVSLRGGRALITELTKLRDQGHSPADVINQSIANHYRGFFPVKNVPVIGSAPTNGNSGGSAQTGGTSRPTLSPDVTSTVERMLLEKCDICDEHFIKKDPRPCGTHRDCPQWIRSALMVRRRVSLARWQQLRLWMESLADFDIRYRPWLTILDESLLIDDDRKGGGTPVKVAKPVTAQEPLLQSDEVVTPDVIDAGNAGIGSVDPRHELVAAQVEEENAVELNSADSTLVH
jgi:hypothetical protein